MSNLLVQNIKHTNGTTAQTIDSSGRVTNNLQDNNIMFLMINGRYISTEHTSIQLDW